MQNTTDAAVSVPITKPTQDVASTHDTEKDKDKKEDRKKMGIADVMQMLDTFNSQLDAICAHYSITLTEEDMKICPLASVDHLLSFDTKVAYVSEFFEGKHLEMTERILAE